ncbi:MAG: hypothetical protein KKA73_12695 [Chloroflexi bacterium]|nr:hypothetical protein [Chloroflexota bacterium]MBU1748538.1 hypothetical protein [Chloroflexota bacterium]
MVERFQDHYKTLQVDPDAEPEVVAAAYRRLAAKGQVSQPISRLIDIH